MHAAFTKKLILIFFFQNLLFKSSDEEKNFDDFRLLEIDTSAQQTLLNHLKTSFTRFRPKSLAIKPELSLLSFHKHSIQATPKLIESYNFQIDWFCILIILFSGFILLCSLRVKIFINFIKF